MEIGRASVSEGMVKVCPGGEGERAGEGMQVKGKVTQVRGWAGMTGEPRRDNDAA